MGNENSVFQDCEWGDSVSDKSWIITQGTLPDGSEISLFSLRQNEKKQAELLRVLTKQLRSIRHPCILHFMSSDESVEGPRLMTESVVPLETLIPSLSAIEICAGLQNILEGLSFLHDQAGMCHNNLHIGSVYVAADGCWRLGGLEYAKKISDVTPAFLETTRAARNEAAITPEEKDGKVLLPPDLGHTRDVHALAVLVETFLEKMEDLGDLTKTFELLIQDECLHSNPRQRPTMKSLLNDRLFTTEFLQIATFLKNVILKTEEERQHFFKDLLPKLLKLPAELIGKRLVPSLLSRFVMLDQWAVDYVLPSLLTPCSDQPDKTASINTGSIIPLLHKTSFQQYVIPKLVKMFCVHDLHIRIILLTYFPDYVSLISKETLELDIFPQVLLGLRDTSNTLAALSLHALAEMVPILGRDVIVGGRSKTYFKEGMPKKALESQVQNNCHIEVSGTPENQRRPANVRQAMGRTKLKDLVNRSGENNIKETEEEKERKWKEREKKREEMRKRRADRRQTREIRKKDLVISEVSSPDATSPGIIEGTAQPGEHVSLPLANDSLNNQSIHLDDETVQSDNAFHFSPTQQEEGDDWSDWEDEKGDNSHEFDKGDNSFVSTQDSDISEEIENELHAMDLSEAKLKIEDGESVISSVGTVSDSSGTAHNPAYKSSSALNRTGGKLQLNISNKSKERTPGSESHDDSLKNINPTSISKIQHSSDRVSASASTTKSIPKTKQEPLGSHFDIKSLEIKVAPKVNDLDDFFADMAPKIEVKSSALLPDDFKDNTVPKGVDTVTDLKSVSEGTSTLNFAVENIEDTEAGDGWGDEDW